MSERVITYSTKIGSDNAEILYFLLPGFRLTDPELPLDPDRSITRMQITLDGVATPLIDTTELDGSIIDRTLADSLGARYAGAWQFRFGLMPNAVVGEYFARINVWQGATDGSPTEISDRDDRAQQLVLRFHA